MFPSHDRGGPQGQISVYALGVGSAVEIASREVAHRLAAYSENDLWNIRLEARITADYEYLILHLPDEVLLCNLNLIQVGKDQAWSQLESGERPWRAINGVYDPRIGYVYGDKRDGTLGKLDYSVATHYGELAECILYTPFVYLEEMSIDEIEVNTIPGFNTENDATVMFSMTYDGVTYSMEQSLSYGIPGAYGARFIAYRLGYVDNWFGFKFRWNSRSRMCFSLLKMTYG